MQEPHLIAANTARAQAGQEMSSKIQRGEVDGGGGGVGCSALSGWVTYIHEGVGVEDSLEVVEEIEIFGELLLCSARLLLRRSSCRSVFLFHWAGGGAGSGQRLSPQVQRPPRQMRTSAGAVLRMIIVHLLTLYYFTNAVRT